MLNSFEYDAFGIPASKNVERFGYTGQLYFKDLGLYYYKARIYHPKLGRFLQTDPVGYEDQMNLYAYVGNDPVNMVDPTGEFGFAGAIWGAVSGGIGGALTGYKSGGFSGALKGGGVGALAGGVIGFVAPAAAGAFATNAVASLLGQAGGNISNGANATDNLSVSAALGAGLGGVLAKSTKGVASAAPNIYKDVVGKSLTSNTAPSKVIGSGIIAVSEGVGTAVGETAGKWYGGIVEQMKNDITNGNNCTDYDNQAGSKGCG